MTNGGRKANRTGVRLEAFVESALKEHRYEESSNGGDLFKKRALITSGRYYARGVNVGKTAYGEHTQRRVDLFIVSKELFPNDLIFECKWQQVKGSADEKYPNLVNNIKTTGIPTIVVIGGNGYKPGALEWLKKQVDGIVLMAVWAMEEFQIAVNNGLFSTGFAEHAVPSPKVCKVEYGFYYKKTLWE
jgi:hypothetical protein